MISWISSKRKFFISERLLNHLLCQTNCQKIIQLSFINADNPPIFPMIYPCLLNANILNTEYMNPACCIVLYVPEDYWENLMSSERLHSNSRDVSSRPPTDRRGRHLTPHTSHSHQLPSYKILLIALHTNLRLLLANMYFVGISNILTFHIIITTNVPNQYIGNFYICQDLQSMESNLKILLGEREERDMIPP